MVTRKDYQHIAIELGIDNSDSKLTIFILTNLIKNNDKYKADPKLIDNIVIY